jgi:hypothetical protein
MRRVRRLQPRSDGPAHQRDGMTRILLLVGGAVLVLAGAVFTLQGLNVLGGSAMSGNSLWVVLGPVIAAVGAFLVARGLRART